MFIVYVICIQYNTWKQKSGKLSFHLPVCVLSRPIGVCTAKQLYIKQAVGVCFVRPTAFLIVVAICFAVKIMMVMKYYCPNTWVCLRLG